jgi:vitamin B12/bleomycin/antimicrobial peptide transport system ATP-binding/permease protein
VRVATDAPVDLALGFLSSLLTATIFIGVLWRVGGDITITVFGLLLSIPGYLVVGVIAYSTLITATMMFVGRSLTHVIQDMNQAEAEFRAAAMTLREVGEEIVPPGTEPKERRALWSALRQVIVRWRDLARQLVQTTLVSQGNVLLAPVVAWILCAPKYLAGTMSLGELTQAAAAFVIVQGAFNWLVDNYQRLADWRSAVNRLATLLLALDELCADQNARPGDQALGATNKVPP